MTWRDNVVSDIGASEWCLSLSVSLCVSLCVSLSVALRVSLCHRAHIWNASCHGPTHAIHNLIFDGNYHDTAVILNDGVNSIFDHVPDNSGFPYCVIADMSARAMDTQGSIGLPIAPILDGFVETTPDFVLRTEMDQGPAKVRKRTTTAVREFQMIFIMSKVQTTIFDDFYLSTINGGADSFDFTHPRTEEMLDLRLVKPPEYQALNAKYFRITLKAEALP